MDQRVTEVAPAPSSSATAPQDEYIRRFSVPTRLVHWGLAIPFVLLLVTGATNYWPRLKAVQLLDFRLFAWVHVVLGFGMLGILAAMLVALVPRRVVRADAVELGRADLDDYLWLQHQALRFAGEDSEEPPVRKFNAGQKLNALASVVVTGALLATGLVLGINYVTKEVFEVGFVEPMFRWHARLALLFVPVLLGHLYLALLHPSTRESLRGMALGRVRRDWARRHHPAWVAQQEQAALTSEGGRPRAR